jgi:hypothetical protein
MYGVITAVVRIFNLEYYFRLLINILEKMVIDL